MGGQSSSAGTGITARQLAERSLLRKVTDVVVNPKAADDDLIVTTVDPNGVAVGATFTLAVSKLRQARRVSMTINDDDGGGGLSITAEVKGTRWGVTIKERLTATATDGNDLTVSTNVYFDEILSITLIAKTADAGDDVTFGILGSSFGLKHPIDRVEDVLHIVEIDSGTEQAALAVSSTTVDAEYSAIKGITLAATDVWEVTYLRTEQNDGFGRAGAYA